MQTFTDIIAAHSDKDACGRVRIGPKAVAITINRLEMRRSEFAEGSAEFQDADAAVKSAFTRFGGHDAVMDATAGCWN